MTLKNSFKTLLLLLLTPIVTSAQWEPIMQDTSVREVFVQDTNIFVGTSDGRIYLTGDFGQSWTKLIDGLPGSVMDIGISDSNKLFCSSQRFIYSSNNWFDWNQVYQISSDVTCMTIDGANIYVGGGFSAGIHASLDNGIHWSDISGNLVTPYLTSVAAEDTNLMISLYSHSVFHSTNFGTNWNENNQGILDDIFALHYHLGFYAGGENRIYKLDDGNWKTLLYTGRQMLDFASNELWTCAVGSSTTKVYCSEDSGLNWIEVDAPWFIWAIDIYEDYLLAGSSNGLFKYKIQQVSNPIHFTEDKRLVVFPNPCKDHFIVNCPIDSGGKMELSIMNLLGKCVFKNSYESTEQICCHGITDLCNGIYIVNIVQGKHIFNEKLIIKH